TISSSACHCAMYCRTSPTAVSGEQSARSANRRETSVRLGMPSPITSWTSVSCGVGGTADRCSTTPQASNRTARIRRGGNSALGTRILRFGRELLILAGLRRSVRVAADEYRYDGG